MDKKKTTIFLTGATGLLGSYLLKILLGHGYKVYALARGINNKSAEERVIDILRFWDEKALMKHFNSLTIVEGDITRENLGLDRRLRSRLRNKIDEIFHCAALTKFTAPLKETRKNNVEGTRNVLELGLEWTKAGRLKKINHISTTFVCGTHKGKFKEGDLDVGQGFNNPYEQSKFEAEILVKDFIKKGLKIVIFRPSVILGEYRSGKTVDFKTFYECLYICSLELVKEIPLNTKAVVNLLPVDCVAQAIYTLSTNGIENGVYHITNPHNTSTVSVLTLASKFFQFRKPKLVTFRQYKQYESGLSAHLKKMGEIYLPYYNRGTLFNSDKTQAILRKLDFRYQTVNNNSLDRIFRFCSHKGFIRINKRCRK